LVASYWLGMGGWRRWAAVLLIGVVSAAVALGAPGNFARKAAVAPHTLGGAASSWVRTVTVDLGAWATNGTLLAATVLTYPWLVGLWRKSPLYGRVSRVWLLALPVAYVGLMGLMMAPACLGSGAVAGRVANVVFLVFLLGWFPVVVAVGASVSDRSVGRLYRPIGVMAGLVVVVGMLTQGNFPAAVRDLTRRAPRTNRELTQRYAIIRDAKARGQADVVVPRLTSPQAMIYLMDLSENADDQFNQAAARYFGVRSIAVAHELPPAAPLPRLFHPPQDQDRK
jgi:uncharacterized protein DUF6056